MALNVAKIKSEMDTRCPLFADRDKGDWKNIENNQVTVTGAVMYTDANGDTYGVIVIEERPNEFFLCGTVATKIVEMVCNPENGGTFDDDGIMIEPFKLDIGTRVAGKDPKKSPYLQVQIIE